jgi:hypothetical protein
MQTIPAKPSGTAAPVPADATIVARVQARRDELAQIATRADLSASTRADLEQALAAVATMLTGDLSTMSEMGKLDLSRWLEQSQYLGISAATPATTPPGPNLEIDESAPPPPPRFTLPLL